MNPVPFIAGIDFDMTREYMTADQRFAEKRPDVLTYKTEVLDKDITIAGNIWANLKVSTTGTDADWVVKVLDVYPDTATNNKFTGKDVTYGRLRANGTQRGYARQVPQQL
jgi:predicted acyl esterase